MMKRRVMSVLAVALVAASLLVWRWVGGSDEARDSTETIVVEPRTFSTTVVAVGAVKPRIGSEVRVGSRISGRVWKLRANIGDRVAEGQVIAELETAELDALLAQRRAELKLAEAKLAAFATLAPEEEARAHSDVTRYEAAVKLAAEEMTRQQALFARELVPRATADAARDRHAVAKAELESVRRTLELVRAGHTEGRRQAGADVERARAAVESATVDRSFTVLRAPIAGDDRVGGDAGRRDGRRRPECADIRHDRRPRAAAGARLRRRGGHRQDRDWTGGDIRR